MQLDASAFQSDAEGLKDLWRAASLQSTLETRGELGSDGCEKWRWDRHTHQQEVKATGNPASERGSSPLDQSFLEMLSEKKLASLLIPDASKIAITLKKKSYQPKTLSPVRHDSACILSQYL